MPLTEFVPKMLYIPERLSQNGFKKKKLGIGGTTVFHMVSIGIYFQRSNCRSSQRPQIWRPTMRKPAPRAVGAPCCASCARLCTLCGAMWGGTMWQTQTSTYISTYVECILRNHIYKNHRALFQKPNSMNFKNHCFQKSSLSLMVALPRSLVSFGMIHFSGQF